MCERFHRGRRHQFFHDARPGAAFDLGRIRPGIYVWLPLDDRLSELYGYAVGAGASIPLR